ncbi:MAG: 6-carboxytetrahydropterin synthase [Aridibacter sp.]
MPSFYEVMIERNFSSAHQRHGYKGKCENLHGHKDKIEIFARGEELNNIGLLIDFGDLKVAADEIVDYLDHRNINELPPFDEELNPSAENLAAYICEYLNSRVGDERVQVYKVRCYETPTSVATFQID